MRANMCTAHAYKLARTLAEVHGMDGCTDACVDMNEYRHVYRHCVQICV